MKSNFVYRARGIYATKSKPTWITTGWRRSREEALEDKKIFGTGRYTQVRIHKLNWVDFANKNRRLPKIV